MSCVMLIFVLFLVLMDTVVFTLVMGWAPSRPSLQGIWPPWPSRDDEERREMRWLADTRMVDSGDVAAPGHEEPGPIHFHPCRQFVGCVLVLVIVAR